MDEAGSFGRWMQQRREELDLTRADLAEQVGCSISTIYKIESGERRPSKQTVERLARFLGVPPEEFNSFMCYARQRHRAATLPPPPTAAPEPPRHTRTHNLPAALTSFIGREQETDALRALLLRADVRLVTLTGTGGVGKTRLALHIAHMIRDTFADGVWLVPLASIRDSRLVCSSIAQPLGIQEHSDRALIDRLCDELHNRRMLLVLDNFEHLVSAASIITTLLAAAPGLTALVTSRTTLHLYGEHAFPVVPFETPHPDAVPPLEMLARLPAVALFVARAQAADISFALTSENAPEIAAICARLDGLPLAIELAAARIKRFSCREMRDRLDHRLALLVEGASNLPDRHRTLSDAIAWSYDLLSPDERSLFERLAVFTSGCTHEAVEAVCRELDIGERGAGFRDQEDKIQKTLAGNQPQGPDTTTIQDRLEALISWSLLRLERTRDGKLRFAMLETIREYARDRLETSGRAAQLQRQHARYYAALAEQAERELAGEERAQWMERLEIEQANLRTALDWAYASGDLELVLRLSGALWQFWHDRRLLSEGNRWLEVSGYLLKAGHAARHLHANEDALRYYDFTLEALAGHTDDPRTWEARDALGDVYTTIGRYEDALAMYTAILQATGVTPDMACHAYRKCGNVLEKQGRYEEAHESLDHAMAIAESGVVGISSYAIPMICADLGLVFHRQGEYDQAIAVCEQGLAALPTDHRTRDDTVAEANLYSRLGAIYGMRGNYPRAQQHFERSLIARESIDDLPGMIVSHNNLGYLWQLQSEYGHALRHYQIAEELARNINLRYALVSAVGNASYALICLGNYREAEQYCQETLTLSKELHAKHSIAQAHNTLGILFYHIGDYDRAIKAANNAIQLDHTLGCVHEEAIARMHKALTLNALGRFDEARGEAQHALDQAIAVQADRLKVEALNALAEAALGKHETDLAANYAREAVAFGRAIGSRYDTGIALRLLGQAVAARDEPFEALFAESMELLSAINDRFEQARTWAAYGQALIARGDMELGASELARASAMFATLGAKGELARVS